MQSSNTVVQPQATESGASRHKILPLTSLRFFAAFWVILSHTRNSMALLSVGDGLGMGFVSVSFFFTLSGYILSVVYLRDDGQIDRWKFWGARFARVYPLFLITLVADTPFLLHSRIVKYGLAQGIAKTAVTFVANCFMLQAWAPNLRGIDNPNWSLAAETFFYLLFPVIGIYVWRRLSWAAWKTAILVYAGGLLLVYSATRAGLSLGILELNPVMHLHEFVVGILIARTVAGLHSDARRALDRFAPALFAVGLALFVLVVHFVTRIPSALTHDGLLVPAYVLLIVASASSNTFISRPLSAFWLVVLGEASYGMYLISVPMWNLFSQITRVHTASVYALYFCCTIAASVVSFYFLETPIRRAILRWFARRRKPLAATSAAAHQTAVSYEA